MTAMSQPNRIIKSRNPKINSKQKKILLQFLADYPAVYFHKITTAFTFDDHAQFWKQAASVLNIFGPPVKTTQTWKKSWKDMRLRYRKAGIDTKRILRALKTERIVDTKALLENVEKLACAKGIQRVRILEKCGVNISYLDDDSDDISNYMSRSPHRKPNPVEFKVDLSKTREVAAELGIASLENKLQDSKEDLEIMDKCKDEMIDDYEELYLEVEDLTKSDDDFTKDSPSYHNGSITEVTLVDGSKLLQTSIDNEEDTNRLGNERITPSSESVSGGNNPRRNDNSPNKILNAVLLELRKHNSLQKEKLEIQRNFFNHQKTTMQRMLDAQKEMANAQTALANTVKSFVNNISFNS